MRRIFWGGMYLLAAALAALTIYLYVLPESEIVLAEGTAAEQQETQTVMPVFTIGGVTVETGSTRLDALLDAGFQLKFELDGNIYDLNVKNSSANAHMQYEVLLFRGEQRVAKLWYTNTSAEPEKPGDCTIDGLEFTSDAPGWKILPVLVDGQDMSELDITGVAEAFPAFTEKEGAVKEYRRAAISERQSMVAYIRGGEGQEIAAFGIKNYMPGSGTAEGGAEENRRDNTVQV